MSDTSPQWLSLTEIRKRWSVHGMRRSDIPVEHYLSLPLPTTRWGEPGYTSFASPALRRPGQPPQIGTPDRWWALSAQGGGLLIYALWRVLPYAEEVQWTSVTLPPVARTVPEQQQELEVLEDLLNGLAPPFFTGEAGEGAVRRAAADLLKAHVPAPLLPWYRALTPDFFTWLEA